MKKTQIATLKILYTGNKSLEEIYNVLHKFFPAMKTGINRFNMSVMLTYLWDHEYVYRDQTCFPDVYSLAPKGKEYILKLKQWGVNNDE